MSAWWDGAAVLWDLESDGVDPTAARIITACVAEIAPGLPPKVTNYMAQTERPIPAEASAVHGISTDHADEHGRPREEVVAEIATHLATAGRTLRVVVGHNIGHYDLTLLDRELRRLGIGSLGTERDTVTVRIDGRQAGAFHVIDSLVLDKHVDPYRRGKRQLPVTAEHYGVPLRGDAHTADADALASGRIVWAIAKRCEEPSATLFERYRDRRKPEEIVKQFYALGPLTLPQLHRAQIGWATEQADGLRKYFTTNPGTGDPAGVTGDWPLQPIGTVDVVTGLV